MTCRATKTRGDAASTRELATLCDKRVATYAFIARIYRVEVDQAFLDELRAMKFPVSSGNESIDKGYHLMARFVSNTWKSTLTDLAIDYVRTFIGHGVDGFSAAYPFESVYTSEKRLLMQEARDEVLMAYRANKLDKSEDWKDSEDHIALELEFMRTLAERSAAALREGNDDMASELLAAQKNFLEEHLISWVPMMTSDMKKFSCTDLYQGLAYLTDGFLEEDRAFLGSVLEEG